MDGAAGSPDPDDTAAVLLVMSDGADRQLLAETLEPGYRVSATDEPAALGEPFDCAVLDPPSYDAASDLVAERRAVEGAFLPVVLLLDGGRGERLPEAVWTDVDDVIETPVSRAALRARIDHLVERRRTARALREQNERLDAFASVVSHDLRNPLTVAEGRLELAMEAVDNEDVAHAAEALERMRALVEDLLTLAREGSSVEATERVDVGELAGACWSTVDTAQAELSVPEAVVVEADRGRLRQLLENLIRNAVEHGGDAVTVEIGPLGDGFYVADDGPGIPAADRERVLDAGVSGSATGTGLGLAIVTEIAEAHGWSVAVTEGAAGGARFEFTGVGRAD